MNETRPGYGSIPELTDADFSRLKNLIEELTGIRMTEKKRALVAGRLAKRLRHYSFTSYSDYFMLLKSEQGRTELSVFVDLITTHVTHFFREPEHFHFLGSLLENRREKSGLKVWCAACSTGEEVYSIAMVLRDRLGPQGWHVLGTDISEESVQKASGGLYPLSQAEQIPQYYLKNFALKGKAAMSEYFTFDPTIRQNCSFLKVNLNESYLLPDGFTADIVFLRNVMIYFENDVRKKVVEQISRFMKNGGLLFLGHAETLNALNLPFEYLSPAVYRKAV